MNAYIHTLVLVFGSRKRLWRNVDKFSTWKLVYRNPSGIQVVDSQLEHVVEIQQVWSTIAVDWRLWSLLDGNFLRKFV